jgi:hypothetical protein
MPTEAEYAAFYEEILRKHTSWSWEKTEQVIRERWKTDEDYQGYRSYVRSVRARPERMVLDMWTPVSREYLLETIKHINFNNSLDRAKLRDAISRDSVPWVPVGRIDGKIYRFTPAPETLLPDELEPKVQNQLMPLSVLGVNTNVQPLKPVHRRKANLSEESTVSNESDDPGIGGFVFHQLGILEVWCDEPEKLQNYDDADDGPWQPAEFCVVNRFGTNGVPDGIYIVCDFYPEDDITGERYPKSEEFWGYLGDRQLSVAKIADRITDLGFNKTLRLTEVVDYPVEVVRTIMTSRGTIIRATIAE